MAPEALPLIPSGTLRQVYFDLSINGNIIPMYNYFQSFTYERKTNGTGNTGTITLFDPTWTFLESFILLQGATQAKIVFRYGWADYYSPAIDGVLTGYAPEFTSDGVTLRLEFYDISVDANYDRGNLSFKAGMRISDIVQKYADNRGIKAIIEKTRGGFDSPIIQRNCNTLYFIQNELVPRAVNLQGLGGYTFFFDESGALHFHTPLYNPKNTGKIDVYKTYIVYRGMNGEVLSFSPSEDAYKQVFLGSHDVYVESVDPIKKKVIKTTVNASNYPIATITGTGEVNVIKPKGNSHGRVIKSAHPKQDNIDDYGKSRFALYNLNNYTATAEIVGDPIIPIQCFVEFIVITAQDRIHPLSGIYWVTGITQSIEGGNFTSSLEMSRNSMNTPRSASQLDLETRTKIGSILREVRESNLVTKVVEPK
jgi:hypothetical protein